MPYTIRLTGNNDAGEHITIQLEMTKGETYKFSVSKSGRPKIKRIVGTETWTGMFSSFNQN